MNGTGRLPPEEIEGRLNAQREALALLFALLAEAGDRREKVCRMLDEYAQLSDHQEDPGAVPAAGFATQEAKVREFQVLAEDVRALIKAERRGDR